MLFCREKSYSSIDQAVDTFRDTLLSCQSAKAGTSICTYPNSLEFHEARKVIGDAFGGRTAEQGSSILNKFIEPTGLLSDDATQDRQDLNAFALGFFQYDLLHKGGTMVGIRDGEGILQAVIVFREYDTNEERHPGLIAKISSFFVNVRAYIKMMNDPLGLPNLLRDKPKDKQFGKLLKKLEPVGDLFREWHAEYGPSDNHWYVGIVASNPDGQGKGYCKEAMSLLCQAADECNVACYLECEAKKRKYYEKFDFKAVTAGSNVGNIKIGNVSISGNLMIRHAKRKHCT